MHTRHGAARVVRNLAQDSAHDQAVRLHDTPGAGPAIDAALYDALYAALSANARGRAFLDEVARRARQADTSAALAALARIEMKLNASLAAQAAPDVAAAPPVPNEPVADYSLDDAPVPYEAADHEDADPLPAIEAQHHAPAEPAPAPARPTLDQSPHADLIAQVMALSPEERIALFS
ncbi:MAG: hypothetical protein OJF62_000406 [Pseudolabrys sp.]|jgi:hypothetical protein|nr:hypothetical protein [Pseudolabrys sp.]